ncbi:hypothetical protein THAOC_26522, partial [Thalassiosira oceanica]
MRSAFPPDVCMRKDVADATEYLYVHRRTDTTHTPGPVEPRMLPEDDLLEHQYHDPALDSPALTFDATDPTSDYTGPPRLPERYRQVILPIDWHLPNKIKKRKRLHRKSHGRIGFHALNQQISRAWGNVEEEVRIFCENLAATEAAKYRMVMPREVKEL